jgi:hypothetical protein
MRLVFKSEYDSTEVYAIEDNNNNTLARIRIHHDTRILSVFYLDFTDNFNKVKESIFPLLRMLKNDLNINGYKMDPELMAYNDYTDRYNTDIIE